MAWTYWQNCTPITPCDCSGSIYVPPVESCTGCLKITSPSVLCEGSTPPGGVTGTLDLAALNTVTACSCDVTYTVLEYDTIALEGVTIDENGVLEWTTTDDGVPSSYVEVKYLVDCGCDGLSGQGIVSICIKNICPTAPCEEGTECNPTTGDCDPIIPNITIE